MNNDDQETTMAVGRPIGRMEIRTFRWGASNVIYGNEVRLDYEGVENVLLMPYRGGSGPTIVGERASCAGCPHLGVSSKAQAYCAHPLWIELWECPQHEGAFPNINHVSEECPMLGLKTAKALRRYRIKRKAQVIFWDYYRAAGKNPRAEGFIIPRFGRK